MTEVAKFVEIVERRAFSKSSSSEILYGESRDLSEDAKRRYVRCPDSRH